MSKISTLLSDIETLKQEAAADLVINSADLATASIRIPVLHSRWLNKHTDEKIALRGLRLKRNQVYKDRWEYYLGKSDPAIYKANPFPLKVLRSDVQIYLDADPELADIKAKMELQQQKIEFIESVLQQINQRNWQIKSAIDWIKFTQGEV